MGRIKIELNGLKLSELSEAEFLTLILAQYQANHLNEDARQAFALMLHCSDKHIGHALAGQTHLGDEAWAIIAAKCGSNVDKLRTEWLREIKLKFIE